MIRLAVALVLAASLAIGLGAVPASASTIAFGRKGGNILPFTVAIARDGTVTTSGETQGARTKLTPPTVAGLLRLARAEGLTGSSTTECPGTLPDVAALWIRIGTRTTTVHGGCRPRFNELYAVLTAVVGL